MPHNRRSVRETVLSLLYSYLFNKDNFFEYAKTFLDKYDEQYRKFGSDLLNKTILHTQQLDEFINKKLSKWELDRVPIIDRIILRIGICEILYFEDIPPKVTINEMIELAKEFSNAKSSKFVNGILDAVLDELQQQNKLSKSGRGLIEQSFKKHI